MNYWEYFCRNELELFSQFEDNDDRLKRKLRFQQNEQDQSKLFLAALIKLMLDKKIITPQELAKCIVEVDNMDGFEDGRADVELTPNGPVCENPVSPITGLPEIEGDISKLAGLVEEKK